MPAKYGDLGKKANDLFNKGYEQGKYKVEVSSKAEGFEFTTKGHQDAAGKISASHEMKHPCFLKTGSIIKTTFTPGKNALDIEAENSKLVKGLKLTAIGSFPIEGCPVPAFNKIKGAWSNDKLNVNFDSNLSSSVNVDAVFAAPVGNFGVKLGLNAKSLELANREIAFNMNKGSIDYTFRTALSMYKNSYKKLKNDQFSFLDKDYNVVFHNQVNANTAIAVSSTYNSKGMSLALASKVRGACGSSNQFKIANNGVFALSHITPLRNGAELTISGEFNATNLQAGGHKLGAGLKFNL